LFKSATTSTFGIMKEDSVSDKKMRICVVGPGAIGGVVAGVLRREGFNIHLVTKYKELAEKINSTGIEVSGRRGDFTQLIPSVATIDQLEGVFDYALIVTKAEAMVESAKALLPYLHENSRVVSMQNGICEEMLAEVVGEKRTIGCVVGWRGIQHGPGKVEMTTGGECVLGNWNREPDDELVRLAWIMGHLIETRVSKNIFSELYSKMVINSCITTLGVICGSTLGEIMASRKARNIFIEIVREALLVAGTMELKVAPGANGKLDYYKFLAPGFLANLKRHLTIRVIGIKYRKHKSSSLRNLKRGLKTEVNYYNGYMAAKGSEFKIPTPVNEQLTQMVHEIEEGKRQIGPENLRDIHL
jgi:2-dehydropantoate 2-reductase